MTFPAAGAAAFTSPTYYYLADPLIGQSLARIATVLESLAPTQKSVLEAALESARRTA